MIKSNLNLAFIAASPKEQEAEWIKALKSEDASLKAKADACRELAVLGSKEAIAPLAALLLDEKLSHMARYGLEPNSDPAVDEALREALSKAKGRVLVGIIGSVGMRRDTEAVEQLAGFLKSRDAEVVDAAARALGNIGNRGAVRALMAALNEVPGTSQLAVFEGLLRIADSRIGDRPERAQRIYDRLREIKDAPHQVRAAALRGAVLTRANEGIPLLLEAVRGDDFVLVSAAARTAQEMKGTAVAKALAEELEKLSTDKQIVIISTLAKRGDKDALPAIFNIAKKGEKPARIAAVRAMPEIGCDSAMSVLEELQNDSDEDVAKAAKEGFIALPSCLRE
ncbi:MAG: HEAT repeat domain-containing protein [bacterium]|jgi:HEAT repeat protein